MPALKDLYSPTFYDRLSSSFSKTIPSFNSKQFIDRIFDESFEEKELLERMRHTTTVLHSFLPEDFAETVPLLKEIIQALRDDQFPDDRFEMIFLADYIERYGINHFEESVEALEFVTQFVSCEFAVRPFLLRYRHRMMEQMVRWSLHKSAQVRRLSSEGSRPRLPWAIALPHLKQDPTPILPILENLKTDPSESVRRSVANNLNDISKDHPDVVIEIAKRWKGISRETDKIIKHGCRTLLKSGHNLILDHFALSGKKLEVADFKIMERRIRTGGKTNFRFAVTNKDVKEQLVRMEYAVYYRKANGTLSKKVFKISERKLQPAETIRISRGHSFKLITTRKYYSGNHRIAVIINGEEKASGEFRLTT
jgi:3-methyladenine DNA glycosylase AlkC